LFNNLRWMRAIGDTAFTAGAIAFVIAVARMTLSKKVAPQQRPLPEATITGANSMARESIR
jgi:hypothetical protein